MARPTFKPTAVMRRNVAAAAGGGMSHEEICLALEISRPTLSKHFGHELAAGAAKKRMEVLVAQHAAAKKGNVAAQKAYMANAPAAAAPKPPAAEKTAPLGKKEQQQVDAVAAAVGTEWGDLLQAPPAVH